MKCPFCRETSTEIYNSRATKSGNQVWRRRRCESCEKSFTTYELIDLKLIRVIERSGRTAPYSRARLYSDIYGAFSDIKNKAETIDLITENVESKILELKTPEISSGEISSIVLTALKAYDTTAFLRYLAANTDLTGRSQLKKELKKY